MVEYHVGQIVKDIPRENLFDILKDLGLRPYEHVYEDENGEKIIDVVVGRAISEEDDLLLKNTLKRIQELRIWFRENDYKYMKYLRGDYTDEEWSSIKDRSTQKSKEMKALINTYNEIVEKYTTPEINN